MVTGNCRDVSGEFFFGWEGGWEEGNMLGELSIEELVMGEENFHEGSAGFSSIIKKKTMKK